MLFGHRNDYEGYRKALEYFDSRLPEVISSMTEHDLLIITADHGATRHSQVQTIREYIPILVFNKRMTNAMPLGTVDSFIHIGGLAYTYLSSLAE